MILNGKNFLLNCKTILMIGRGTDEVQGRGKKKTTIYRIKIVYRDEWDIQNNHISTQTLTYDNLEEREEFLQIYIKQINEQLREKE